MRDESMTSKNSGEIEIQVNNKRKKSHCYEFVNKIECAIKLFNSDILVYFKRHSIRKVVF